jgi:hypothetical protein
MKYTFSALHCAGLTLALLFAYSGIFASAQSMESSKEVLAASTHAVELTDKPVRAKFVSGKSDKNTSLSQRLKSLPSSRKVYLVLTGLRAAEQPGTLFHLYLDLPEGVTPKPRNAWHVGSINFYNAVPGADAPKDKPAPTVAIDITDRLRNLHSSQKLTPATTLTIMPTRLPEVGSKPVIENIAIVVK